MPPQFVNPGFLASNAIQQFLMQQEMAKRQQMLDELAAQEQQQTMGIRERQIGMQEEQFAAQQAQRAQQAEAAETEQRAAQNQVGVRGMMADAMTQGPLTPDAAKTIGIMAFREGMDVPPEVAQMQSAEQDATKRGASLADYEAKAMIDASIDAQAPEGDPWRSAGSGTIFHAGSGAFRQAPGAGGGGEDKKSLAEDYTQRSQSRLLAAIDGLEPLIGPDTVGSWRAKGSRAVKAFTPGESNPTVDFDAALGQIKALIGFNELNQMRQASPTGGALGQVSERELAYLQSVAGALDPNQSEAAFRAQIAKVKAEIERVVNYGLEGNAGAGRGSGGFRVIGKRPAR